MTRPPIALRAPLGPDDVERLRAGDQVLLSGIVYTARDAAHERLVQLLTAGKPLPVDLRGQVIYYCGPTPARPGRPIGSAGPTTASRMDHYTPALLGERVREAQVVAFADLGTEAIHRLVIEEFPVVVVNDIAGGDLYEEGQARYRRVATEH